MSERRILTVNAGSATLKFGIYMAAEDEAPRLRWRITVDRLGTDQAELVARSVEGALVRRHLGKRRHTADTLDDLLEHMALALPKPGIAVVAHRVVHGGPHLHEPLAVGPGVLDTLRSFTTMAPLHQTHNIAGIEAAQAAFPDALQVVCFDTAFHRSQPRVSDAYALPPSYYDEGVRRYGFHGLSFEYITTRLPEIAPALARGRTIVAHLGSGASMCALVEGRPVASTMGFSALDGLPMSTRCGQIDPGVLLWLIQARGFDVDALSHLLYYGSGLKGMSGVSGDMRELEGSSDPGARFALEYFTTRIQREIGSLAAAAGGIDGLVFTAGIGEHSARVRADVLRGLAWLGFEPDEVANESASGKGAVRITTAGSPASAWVIPTDEESMLASYGLRTLDASRNPRHAG